jgi:hypothetical protein
VDRQSLVVSPSCAVMYCSSGWFPATEAAIDKVV